MANAQPGQPFPGDIAAHLRSVGLRVISVVQGNATSVVEGEIDGVRIRAERPTLDDAVGAASAASVGVYGYDLANYAAAQGHPHGQGPR